MFSETVTVAATAYEHRRAIRDVVAGLWNRMTRKRVQIVVFGGAGTGKSSLGRLLSGADVTPEYNESTQVETYRLDGTTSCTVLVPPGQESLRAATWNDLVRDVTSGKATVVIHLVSWGINAIEPLPYRGVAGYQREDVRRHYEGEYAEVVEGLRRRVGDKNLSHKTWSVSLIAKNLRDGEGQLVVPTARGYDEPLRTANTKRLVEIIEQEVEHAR